MQSDSSDDLSTHPDFQEQKTPVSRADIYEALKSTSGNRAAVCRLLSIRRQKLNDIINATPALVALCDDLREGIVDNAEQNIFKEVEAGNESASRFVLGTLGKKRGWAAGVEGTGKDGAIAIEVVRFSDIPEVPNG